MTNIETDIAALVNEWFQGRPSPELQQADRADLIIQLGAYARRLREDLYSSNRMIHRLDAELAQARARVAEEIAQAIEDDDGFEHRYERDYAARIVRQHGKD